MIGWHALALSASLAGSLAAAVADARTGLIPDAITRPAAACALGLQLLAGGALEALAGALCAGGTLFALYALTRRRGLGLGDVKLGIAIGAGFGPSAGMIAVGAAFIAGGCVAATLLATRRATRGDALRFGPYLAAGASFAALSAVLAR